MFNDFVRAILFPKAVRVMSGPRHPRRDFAPRVQDLERRVALSVFTEPTPDQFNINTFVFNSTINGEVDGYFVAYNDGKLGSSVLDGDTYDMMLNPAWKGGFTVTWRVVGAPSSTTSDNVVPPELDLTVRQFNSSNNQFETNSLSLKDSGAVSVTIPNASGQSIDYLQLQTDAIASYSVPVGGNLTYSILVTPSTSQPLPDIAMDSASISGSKLTYTYGISGAPGPFTVGLYQSATPTFNAKSDTEVASQTAPAAPNSTGVDSFTLNFSPSSSYPYLIVVADPQDQIRESNKDNNTVSVVYSTPFIDLTSLRRSASPGPTPGITFSYTIENLLTQNAAITFYWASADKLESVIGPAAAYTYILNSTSTKATGAHNSVFIPRSVFSNVPYGTTYLLATATLSGKTETQGVQLFRPVTIADITAVIAPPSPNNPRYKSNPKLYNYAQDAANYGTLSTTLVNYLNSPEAFGQYQINYPERRAAFIGQVAVETDYLTDPRQRGNFATNSTSQGRGLLQITGGANYNAVGQYLDQDLLHDPDLLATDSWLGARASGWYWNIATGRSLNKYADVLSTANITSISQLINAGRLNQPVNALPARIAYTQSTLVQMYKGLS